MTIKLFSGVGGALTALGVLALLAVFWVDGHRLPMLGTAVVLLFIGIGFMGHAGVLADKEQKK